MYVITSLLANGHAPAYDAASKKRGGTTVFDLLTETVVPVTSTGVREPESVTLPELFSRLVSDAVDAFPGLAAHQAQSWYQFLAQLGAIALHRAGREDLPREAAVWSSALSGLTPGCADTAWSLVVEDASAPALLQPPTGRIDALKLVAETPDALDILVTAKNHDRKRARAIASAPHSWLYGLVILQTGQGFSGSGNYGIARMNGGLSSRVLVDRRPNPRWGHRVVRAIRMLLANRSSVLRRVGYDLYSGNDGLALTWLEEWDTDGQLDLRDLDPYFVEVCRRIRLMSGSNGRIRAFGRPSKRPRVEAKALKGNLGDPWVPINLGGEGPSALTVSGNGFDYRLAHRILFEPTQSSRPLSLKELPDESGRDSEIHMAVVVRGQGKTEGFHERVIPLPYSVAISLSFDSEDTVLFPLSNLSQSMVDSAGKARRVLRQALIVYLHGPERPNFKRSDAAPAVTSYDRVIDEQYFTYLFAASDEGLEEVDHRWQQFLREEAFKLARVVWKRTSPPSARREKARAASEAVLFGGLSKHLPDAFPTQDQQEGAS